MSKNSLLLILIWAIQRIAPTIVVLLSLVLCVILTNQVVHAQNLYINQLGYLPDSPKYIFTDDPLLEEIYLIDDVSQDTIFTSAFFPHAASDPATGLDLFSGDFSSIDQPGIYHFITESGLTTHSFSISDTINLPLFKKSLKAFYFQRCGSDLIGSEAAPYYRTRCHRADGFYHSSTDLAGFHPAPGGWHDAGDFGKYVVNAGITVGTLLMAYEYFPTKFDNDRIHIPESGNGIPDILDEVKYELDWLLKMQDIGTGGVFFKLTAENFAAMIMPQDDQNSRYIYELSTTATGNFAAVMARASRIYAELDTAFSNACLDAAELAWDYLENYPNLVPEGGFTNPPGTGTGQYGDADDRDERLWAASELFISTGKSEHHQYFKDHYEDKGVLTGTMWWGDVTNLAQLTYLFSNDHPGIDTSIQEDIRSDLLSRCQELFAQRAGNGFYVVLSPGEYVWGSNSIPLNKAILLILGYEQSGIESYKNAAIDQMNYILGVNVHKLSFVTGVGVNFVLNPHHRPSEPDNIDPAIPGLLVGGPDQYLSDPTLSSLFDSSTPPASCYVDDVDSYASNEIAINWNAPLVFVSGYFTNQSLTPIKKENPVIAPQKIKLLPNYPNPFNGETKIRFVLSESDVVNLIIYSLQGQLIYKKNLGNRSSGESSFVWRALNNYGEELPSGIYYYLIEGKYRSSAERLVIVN
jgi:endoglucanase